MELDAAVNHLRSLSTDERGVPRKTLTARAIQKVLAELKDTRKLRTAGGPPHPEEIYVSWTKFLASDA